MNRSTPTSLLSNRRTRTMTAWLSAVILLVVSSATVAFAANPPPVQIYYVPVPEDQALQAFKSIYPGSSQCTPVGNVSGPIRTYISISIIAEGTIIYYDHWEDDFEIDISTPSQATTEIWGDGDPGNGAPPGIPGDVLTHGTIIVLKNSVDPVTRPGVIDFDGGDKLGSTRSIAMTRAAWAKTPGMLMAGALELYETEHWGRSYTAPVGTNVATSAQLFEYSGLVIMASEDGATVNIDKNADDVIDTTVTLEEGESHLVNGGILAGAKVSADAPVQVALITGDICDIYESRWYALFPDEELSNSYYGPVGTSTRVGGTKVFVHNDGDIALTVNWDTVNGAETPLNVPAAGTVSVIVPNNSGVHFHSADGSTFSALAAVDAASGSNNYNSRADWGFTLVPEPALTSQVLVGWAPGQDPTKSQTENGSPVWVTPVLADGAPGPVKVCVDYNNIVLNRAANRPTDAGGFNFDVELSLNSLASVKVFDHSDEDQTGMMLYICDEHATAGTAALAVVWGQAPGVASAAVPGLDLGTTVPPASLSVAGKSATIEDDANDDGIARPGDTITYDVVIRNASRVDLSTVLVSDTVPINTSYALSTTTFDDSASVMPIPDNDSGTPFPLDDGGVTLPELLADGVYTVTFQVVVDAPFPIDVDRVRNQAIVTIGREIHRPEVETPVEQVPGIDIEKSTNGEDADTPTGPMVAAGDTVTWTYAISGTGNVLLSNVIVTDSIASVAPIYVSGDDNGDDILDPGEIWLYEGTGVAIEGQYANIGAANASGPDNEQVNATDPSHYFGVDSAIGLEKTVDPTVVAPGETVIYSYTVSNEGNTPLANIHLTDDRCAPVDPVLNGDHNVGDDNQDELLDMVELWRYTCSMSVAAPITNTATITGTDVLSRTITDTDTAFVNVLGPQGYFYYLPIVNNQHQFDGLTYPKGMAVHEGRNLLFVTERTNNRLLVVNPTTFETVASAPTGHQPWGVVINEDTNRVYVSNFGSGDVSIYDATTLALVATVAVGDEPVLMEILPDQDLVFVVVRAGSQIAVIEGDSVVQTLGSGGSGPFGIAADPVNQRIYVGHLDSRHLSMLSRVSGLWEAHAQLQYDVGKQLFELAYNPVNEKLYAVYSDGAQWSVDIWKPVPGGVWGRYGTANVGDGGALDSPKVGGAGLEVNPSTGRAFNVNTTDGTVSVIDGASNNVTRTVTVGEDPFPIAMDSQRNMVYIGLRESGGIVKISDE